QSLAKPDHQLQQLQHRRGISDQKNPKSIIRRRAKPRIHTDDMPMCADV
ncbi:hypothetical protein GWI33_004012, partial [Rhynchophorus ferrugineus]